MTYQSGDPFFSIRVGDRSFDLSRYQPFSNFIVYGAQIFDADNIGEALGNAFLRTPLGIVSRSPAGETVNLVGDANEFVDAVRRGEWDRAWNSGREFLAGRLSMFAPGITRDVARATDPVRRETSLSRGGDITSRFRSGIPGLRETLPERLSAFGEPAPEQFGASALNPITSRESGLARDPVLAEAERLGYRISQAEDRERLAAEGPAIREVMRAVMQNPDYVIDAAELREADPSLSEQEADEIVRETQREILSEQVGAFRSAVGRALNAPQNRIDAAALAEANPMLSKDEIDDIVRETRAEIAEEIARDELTRFLSRRGLEAVPEEVAR